MSSSRTETREIRRFGLIACLFFGCIAVILAFKGRMVLAPAFGLLSALGVGLLLLPSPLAPIYRGWMKTAMWIGHLVSLAVLTIAYYLVVTPSGLIKRCIGGRPLPMKPDPGKPSYWATRSEPAQSLERFLKRY